MEEPTNTVIRGCVYDSSMTKWIPKKLQQALSKLFDTIKTNEDLEEDELIL